ncbi:hypothetical protein D3C86_2149700 [compost metagenome]
MVEPIRPVEEISAVIRHRGQASLVESFEYRQPVDQRLDAEELALGHRAVRGCSHQHQVNESVVGRDGHGAFQQG